MCSVADGFASYSDPCGCIQVHPPPHPAADSHPNPASYHATSALPIRTAQLYHLTAQLCTQQDHCHSFSLQQFTGGGSKAKMRIQSLCQMLRLRHETDIRAIIKLLYCAYLVCEARLRAVAMVSTYTSATDGGMCLISTAQGTSSLNIHTAFRLNTHIFQAQYMAMQLAQATAT